MYIFLIISLFILFTMIVLSSLIYRHLSKCGNSFSPVRNITKCSTLYVDLHRWIGNNKNFSKEINSKYKNNLVSKIYFNYNGMDYKNIMLRFRFYHPHIGENSEKYLMFKDKKITKYEIRWSKDKGIMDVLFDKDFFENNIMKENFQMTFYIYPALPYNVNYDIYADPK